MDHFIPKNYLNKAIDPIGLLIFVNPKAPGSLQNWKDSIPRIQRQFKL